MEVIITGPIDINDIFESLAEVEDNLIEAGKVGTTDDWEVPFSKNYSMPEKSKEEIVLVPGEHDERGKVVLAWRLPFKYRDNLERIQALGVRFDSTNWLWLNLCIVRNLIFFLDYEQLLVQHCSCTFEEGLCGCDQASCIGSLAWSK